MAADSFPIQWTLRGAIVRLPDEIDTTNSELVRRALSQALDSAPAVLVADMTLTTYCCSEGMRALVNIHQAALRGGIPLRIAGVHPLVRRMLMLTGINELLDVYPSTDAAFAPPTLRAASAGTEAGSQG